MKIGDRVITISGEITDYHNSANLLAVRLDGYIGQEWFSKEEIEKEE